MIELLHRFMAKISEPSKNSNTMFVGLSTIAPGKIQARHIHYGDEQLMYIIEGEGEQVINGVKEYIKPGMIVHIEPGSAHETKVFGDKPMKKLLISIPASLDQMQSYQETSLRGEARKADSRNDTSLSEVISYVNSMYLSKYPIPVTIFEGDTIISSSAHYPQYCNNTCALNEDPYHCQVFTLRGEYTSPQYSGVSAFVCPYGLTVFSLPILYQDLLIGYIKAGHIKDQPNPSLVEIIDSSNLFETPKSTANRIVGIMEKIRKDILEYFTYQKMQFELLERDEKIDSIVKSKVDLEDSIVSLQKEMLNIQINYHFLFNTLNAIANLALRDESIETYTAMIELSNMFRYSLRKSGELVSIIEEVQNIKNYINLQKLRYRERVVVNFDIDSDLYDFLIPFNTLQPIVENSFKHGFKNRKSAMEIRITIKSSGDWIEMTVSDNGNGIDAETIDHFAQMNQSNRHVSSSGLSMIQQSLASFYNDRF